MTEKEYKKLISEIDISTEVRCLLNQEYDSFVEVIAKLKLPFIVKEIKKSGIFQSQMAINSTNYFTILVNSSVELPINENYHRTLIINEILKEIIINQEIKSYEVIGNIIKIKKENTIINIKVVNEDEYNLEIKKLKFIEEISQKYTLFKNAYKLIKYLSLEANFELFDDYTNFIIFTYGLEKHYSSNKYDNYMVSYVSALDDLINTKKIELQENYTSVDVKLSQNIKGYNAYLVTDPFNELINLTSNINDANIGEVRKFKKKISKLYEQVSVDNGSSSILTLDINPLVNNDNTISWSYNVVGRNIQNSGGTFQNTESEKKNASLKAFFRGLKAIVTSNIYNKNITVVAKYKDILKCVEKDPTEADNNSRRKTITKYIEDNKLLISYQIKE